MSIANHIVEEKIRIELNQKELEKLLTDNAKCDERIKALFKGKNISEYDTTIDFRITEKRVSGVLVSFDNKKNEKIN
jgi:hypothetical protein